MWHPNIYENGDVCISILHPPVDDPTNTELPSEKWNPAQNVRLVMFIINSSMFDEVLEKNSSIHCAKTLKYIYFYLLIVLKFFNRTVMMSIISLLNEPNTFSPANVDASVMYRRYIESKGADKEYEQIIK